MRDAMWKKWVSMLIIITMVLSLVSFNVLGASIAKSYTYQIKVKNGDVKYAGTDGDVYCVVKTHSGGTIAEKIDSKANDFERNDCRTYNVTLELQPWEIKEVGLKNTGKDGMYIDWFEFKLPNGTWIKKDVNAWFEKQGNKTYERTYSVWSSVDRQIKSRGNFDSQFSGTKYFDVNTISGQSDIVMSWDGKVSDQYFTNYDFFKYYGAVNIGFSPKATSYGDSGISSIDDLTGNSIATVAQTEGYDSKITINTNKLLEYMKKHKIYRLDLKSELDYMSQSDEYASFSKSYTIYRKGFELEKATAITAAYTPAKDNYFYNSNDAYKTFEIKIPVKDMNNYSASTIASSLVSNIKSGTSPAKVYYDTLDKGGCIMPKSVRSQGSDIYLTCDAPRGYANNDNIGLTVVIENATATYNGQTYILDRTDSLYKHYISTHKVDTKGLTHTLKDENGDTVNQTTGFDTYKSEHKFKLEVDAGQNIYIDNNKGGRTEGNFSYRLYSKDKSTEIALKKHNGLSATSNVPHAGNSLYSIAPAEKLEGEYKLVISSRDFANNLETTTVPVKLDMLAPRATYTVKEVTPADMSKRNEYAFKINDASGTGRLYYTFVRKGENIPDTSVMRPESSGAQDTVYEKWGFIEQTNGNAQTVVLNLKKGDYFEGTLYWYTVDDAGNDSRTENNSGTNKNGYFYKNIVLSNIAADCEFTLDDVTPGKPEYKIGFETAEQNKVEYKWIGNGLTTPSVTYSSDSVPGASVQKDGRGNSVTMNGEYSLEYVVTTPDGNSTKYTRKFTFDNTEPEIAFGALDELVSDTEKIKINVKDITNIDSIKYQLLTAAGEAVGEEVELSAGLPVVSNEVTLAPDKTGAYKIKVTATDINGQTAEAESAVFSIRAAAPQITVTEQITNDLNGTPITNSQDYKLKLSVSEAVANINDFEENQVMRYRTSADGINYSAWVTVSENILYVPDAANRINGALEGEIEITSPVALNNGENRVYVQAVFTDKDADLNKIRAEFIGTSDETLIIYDVQAPQYKIELDDTEMTNESVTGTLTFTDDFTAADKINYKRYSSYISLRENSVSDLRMVMDIEISENVNGEIVLTDTAGNEARIPVNVYCIDRTPPYVSTNESYSRTSGEREDHYLSFYIDEAIEENTKFALVDSEYFGDVSLDPSETGKPVAEPGVIEDDLFGPSPANVKLLNKETEYNYENGESKTYYEVIVYADEELDGKSYVFAAKTEDALSNSTKEFVGLEYGMITLKNAIARVKSASCVPEKAGSKTALTLQMSVPVYLMPDSNVPGEIKALNLADGRIDTSENAEVQAFAESIINNAANYTQNVSLVIDSIGDKDIYFTDEFARVYKQTITVKALSEKETDTSADACTAYVSFGNEPPVNVTLYRADKGDSDISSWAEIDAETIDVLDFTAADYYVTLTARDDAEADLVVINEADYISGDTGEKDFEPYSAESFDGRIYKVNDTLNTNKLLGYTADVTSGEITDCIGSVFELDLKDTTGPVIDVDYSTKGYTKNDVVVSILASDPDLAANKDASDENSSGEDPTSGAEVEIIKSTAEEIAIAAGIQSMEISDITTENISDYSELAFTDIGQTSSTNITFEANGYAVVKVTNTLGLISYKEIKVDNINKEVIEEGTHYNVKYYDAAHYDDYYEDECVEVEPNGYYKEVIAKVEITDEGLERGLTVSNNMGEQEKALNSFDNTFIFKLNDMYGHSSSIDVSFDRFDLDGPTIAYELSTTKKTNEAISVYLKVNDLLTSAAGATLTAPDGTELTVTEDSEKTEEDGTVTKIYKANNVSSSGLYKATATDALGNKSYMNFVISNIDTTVPQIKDKVATTAEPTRQMVGVKLYYSEPGVTITKVEPVGGTALEASDVIVDSVNSTIRFQENGTVSVWFADEYGNEGADIVTVSNINRTPPSLKAVATVAQDLLSVDVRFEKNEDEQRELSDLYVLHNGITPVATETDENGDETDRVLNAGEVTFTFIENGNYTFYAYDSIGNIQSIPIEITQIDRTAPVITDVKWSYKYYGADGSEHTASYSLTPGDEVGYNIVEDETYVPTNQDITATVTTDYDTRFVGSNSDVYSKENSIVYDEDGWFNFNLERPNMLMDSYGLGLYVIDKVPPVIEGVEDLMFFENPKAGTPYNKSLLEYSAYDERYGEKTDLTSDVVIDWGGFNPEEIEKNTFDKNKPYTITYTVKDKVGNETSVKRKITLVGLFDTMARVNGIYPDSSGRVEIIGDTVEIGLDNFSGTAYARYEKGIHTMGEMKHIGTVIPQNDGKFKLEKLSEGWYTFYVQTDLRDYFCINVYIYSK